MSLLVHPNPTPNGRLRLELRGPRATAVLNLANLAAGVYNLPGENDGRRANPARGTRIA